MAKDLAKELVKAMNEVEEVKTRLFEIEQTLSAQRDRLESALKKLNEIAAFYKIQ